MNKLRIAKSVFCFSKSFYSTSSTTSVFRTDASPLTSGQINNSQNQSHSVEYVDRNPGIDDDIWIGMSSGVDSSTAAAILAEKYDPLSKFYKPTDSLLLKNGMQGNTKPKGRVRGIFMANWSSTARCAEADWNDVQRLCDHIGIECHYVNFERQYWTEVFSPMIEMYKQGQTPNPDVGCNRYIKFGELMKYISAKYDNNNSSLSTKSEFGSKKWWLATGHYARVGQSLSTNSVHLLRPLHLPKDQSYYLSSISPKVLDKIYFPLSKYTKPEVREMAHTKYNLHTADKPDSQGLCFVGQEGHNTFRKFLDEFVESKPGDVVAMIERDVVSANDNSLDDSSNTASSNKDNVLTQKHKEFKTVARHNGIWHATIGQKSGISMPQGSPETHGIWYVHSKNVDRNEILIVQGRDHPTLYCKSVKCGAFEWLGDALKLEEVTGEIGSNENKSESEGKAEAQDNEEITVMSPKNLFIQYRSLQVPEAVESITFSKNKGSMHKNDKTKSLEETYTLSVKFSKPRRAVAPGQYLVLYLGERVLGSGIIQNVERVVDI